MPDRCHAGLDDPGAESSRNPAQSSAALNEALLSQGELGLTPACCVPLLPDGCYTIANAGRISPSVDDRELETAPAFAAGAWRQISITPISPAGWRPRRRWCC